MGRFITTGIIAVALALGSPGETWAQEAEPAVEAAAAEEAPAEEAAAEEAVEAHETQEAAETPVEEPVAPGE